MKKFTLLFLSLFIIAEAQSQVSDSFYNSFKQAVHKNYEEGKSSYSAISNAFRSCVYLRNDEYYAEIKLYTQRGLSDSAAVSLIPKDIIRKFLEKDYEQLFCANVGKAKAFITFYAENFCRTFTPKYEKLSRREQINSEAALLSESLKELLNDTGFKQKMREYASGMDANTMSAVENEITPYFYLHCPALKDDLLTIPELIGRNNLRSFVRDQRWDISNTFRYAIENNKPDTLKPIFLNKSDFEIFKKLIHSKDTEIRRYNAGNRLNDVQWPDDSSNIQTFAIADKAQNVTLLFQLRYFYKQIATRLFIEKIVYTPVSEIKDKTTITQNLQSRLEPPPGSVNPYWKPEPPKPEENHVVH